MAEEKTQIRLFEEQKVRTIWNAEEEEWYFSVVDVCNVLAESASKDPGAYWRKLKQRLKEEGSEVVTNCHGLKLPASDGKLYKTDCLDTEGIFRLIQSIPSSKAEPFKMWMAQVAKERLDEMQDPEQGIHRALAEYKALGYSDNWINQRLKSIEIRKDLTDEWKKHGLKEGVQFATCRNGYNRYFKSPQSSKFYGTCRHSPTWWKYRKRSSRKTGIGNR